MANLLRSNKFLSIMLVVGILGAILAATFLLIQPLKAYTTGVSGRSGNPATTGGMHCTGCHGGGAVPTVALNAPPQVASGETVAVSFSITSTAPSVQMHAGLDVSATGGVLASINAETKIMDGEITHTGPKSNDGSGTAEFMFNWTAPSHPTLPMTYTLYAAGNSVLWNGTPGGDNAATDVLEIVVAPECAADAATAVVPTITANGSDVELNWSDDPANSGGYEVWRSLDPYFAPDDPGAVLDQDSAATTYTHTGGIGDSGSNWNYIVRALNCDDSQFADSVTTGEFDFDLVAGSALHKSRPTAQKNAGGTTPSLTLEEVIPSTALLDRPVVITHAGDGRLFIVEKPGRIRIYDGNSLLATPFLDIETLVDDGGNEQGLLGLAFHPDYANNGYFYVNYTYDPAGPGLDRTRIARYQVSALSANVADPSSATVLLEFAQDRSNHNGGDIHFSPNDGYLYISVGDGGVQGDPNDRAQTNSQLLGKMLRIDVDSTGGADCDISGNNNYGIPADNPYVGVSNSCDEIWQNGMRNPWRFSFDKDTADMWIGDVGYGSREEIDFQAADSNGGENWGWRCYEGNVSHNTSGCSSMSNYDFPVHDYSHSSGNCSVTGGFVYRGDDLLALNGHYLFADYCSRRFWSLSGPNHDLTSFGIPSTIGGSLGNPTTFGEDVDGNIYVAEDFSNASIFKVSAVTLPCMDETATTILPIIMSNNSDVELSWSDNVANKGGYAIHRTTTPYFTPSIGTIHATLPAGSEVYTDTGVLGDVDNNYNYVVQARNCDASAVANSKEVGEFDYSVEEGN